MTLLAITADLHVDAYGSRIDPETGLNLREIDFLRTVGWVAATARERGAEALIVAGDYTESKAPARGPRIARIARQLALGPDRQIHVRGNHDSEQAGDSIITVLGSRPGWSGHVRPAVEVVGDVAVCVIPFMDRRFIRAQPGFESIPDADVYRILAEQYQAIATGLYVETQRAGARAAILVGHQQLAGGRMNDAQAAFMGDLDLVVDSRALAAIGFQAVVFGHVHRGQTVIDGPAPVVFAGSVERVDFAEEPEEKSFVLLDVDASGVSIERIPTPARRFVTLDDATIEQARLLVPDAIVRARFTDPDTDLVDVRRYLEELGAFEVTTVSAARREAPAVAGGLAESLTAVEALETYFADDEDRDALVALGRGFLEAAA